MIQLRMERENAESLVRQLEDQLTGLQEELRREAGNRAETDEMHTVHKLLLSVITAQKKGVDIPGSRARQLIKTTLSTSNKHSVAPVNYNFLFC